VKNKNEKWLYADPSLRIPLLLIKNEVWRRLTYSAIALYIYMRVSICDSDNGYKNMDEQQVKFGPKDAARYGMPKGTYYKALNNLLEVGLIEEVQCGSHGRQGIYNMLTLEWIGE